MPPPPDGGGGGGTDPDPPPAVGWPTTTDPVLLAMRPTGRVVASGTVANTAARDTESERQVNAILSEARTGYGYWDYGGPDYRTAIFMQPGTYTGGGQYEWRSLVGTNPANRTVMEARNNSGGVVHSFSSLYMENLRLVPLTTVDNSAPKYPWHITGGRMCIAANCAFDLSQIESDTIEGGSGIAGWIGADGDSGMTIILYKCDFIPGPKANTLNIHDGGPPEHPMTLVFVDCTGLDNLGLVCPGGASTDGQKNRLYVINTPCASLWADGNGEVFTNSAAPAATGSTGTITRGVTAWPVPAGGLSELWEDYYYPSSVGAAYKYQPAVTDAAPMAPVPGRTYYTRLRPDRAGRYTHGGVTVTTVGGQISQSHTPSDTLYTRNEPVNPQIPQVDPIAVTSGELAWRAYYAYSRYPGDNGFWHKVRFTGSSAVRVTGSAQLGGLTDCYYSDDGVTLVPVTAGTPHPLPFIRAT